MRKYIKLILITIILLIITACSLRPDVIEVDPHEGMVEVNIGSEIQWIELVEEIPQSALAAEDFLATDGFVFYAGACEYGIDVSQHQLEIDWQAVSDSTVVDFAIIRAAYRGYTEGGIFEDAFFRDNMDGAIANDIDVGVYFFSQAITVQEAIEEAEFILTLVEEYELDLPIYYDWEPVEPTDARTNGLDGTTITDCAIAFCDTITAAGYDTGIYLYRYIAYFDYELERLADYELWVGAPGDVPDFYYNHKMWQYSYTGNVEGIEGDTDLNIRFIYPEVSE